MRLIAALIFGFLLVTHASSPRAAEQILSFTSDITVRADSVLEVVEAITVQAEGREIRRGIYRDIPLRALDENGFWATNGFEIRQILHNGQETPYRTEWHGRFLRIYIGDADVFIPSGQHDYRIAYSTTRQLRYFDRYDELYWNVTGNFWTFPILDASATVALPDGAVSEQIAAYTGAFGESGSNYAAQGSGTSRLQFLATRPLRPGEGLTIAVGFTKGVVDGQAGGIFSALRANIGAVLFALGWGFVFVYFLYMWWRIGRDPPGETVIPLFHPPENLSPAAMSYVHFKAFKNVRRGTDLAFIAALLSLGVKKRLVIEEESGGKVVFTKGRDGAGSLHPGEGALWNRLFRSRERIALTKKWGPTLVAARTKLHDAITREYSGKFFRRNVGWFVPGATAAIVATILGLIVQQPPDEALDAVIPTIFLSVFGWLAALVGWYRFSSPVGSGVGRVFGILAMVFGALLLLGGLAVTAMATEMPAYRFAAMTVFFGAALTVAMFFLLAAPTLLGAKVLSRIEGFKLYLETAEANRLNMRDAPQMSEELYERYLPYAAGLGVEEPWSQAYSAHLERTAPDRERTYHPQWYRGRDFSGGSLAEATSASMAAVSAAMASSMPQPKSSSGSSGGGFSGGGGGGGGGGGW